MSDNALILDFSSSYWEDSTVGELYEFVYGKGLVKNARNENGLYPAYGSNGVVGHHDNYIVKGPAVIVGRKGAAGEVHFSQDNCWPIDTTYLIKPRKNVDEKFTYYLLKSLRLKQFETSTAIPGLNRGDAYRVRIKVPPINEQKSIVAKIEKLFSELDKGIESLKIARAQLKTYRQAVLKHAFEGKLTEQWRKDNADKLESPEQLLARIQQERQARYQHQLEEWKLAVKGWEGNGKEGKRPSKPIKPKQFSSLTTEEITKLGDLPSGWKWIGEIASVGTGVTPLKSNAAFYTDGDIPWVTSGALNDAFIKEPSGYVTNKALNETNLRLFPVNTLVVALYGEGKTRGKCSELLIEATTNQAVAGIIQEGTSEEIRGFLKWFLTKNYESIRLASSGGVQPNLNLGII